MGVMASVDRTWLRAILGCVALTMAGALVPIIESVL